jgi:hypothetical protein
MSGGDHQRQPPKHQADAPGNPAPPGIPKGNAGGDKPNGDKITTQEQQGEKHIWTRAERLMVLFTAGICFATVAYMVIAGFQLVAMNGQLSQQESDATSNAKNFATQLRDNDANFRKQLDANERQFNQQLAKLTDSIKAANRQADASNRQANASDQQAAVAAGTLKETKRQLSTTQANFVAEQRPYLGVFIPQIVPNGYAYTAGIVIGNFGRSAAENVTVAWNVWHNERGRASDQADAFFSQPEQDWHWQNMAPLPPGAGPALPQTESAAHWGPYARDQFLLLSRIYNGLALYGRVKYTDPHGHPFHTDFCVFRPGGNAAVYCDRHNYLK